MPSTGAGWVNLNQWLGLNQQAGQQMQQNAVNAADQNTSGSYGGRFSQGKKAQGGTAWSPATAQSLVNGSQWDAALLGAQMGGQAGGSMKTQQVGGGELGETGRGNTPNMTKWTDAQIKGQAPSYAGSNNSGLVAGSNDGSSGGNPYGYQQEAQATPGYQQIASNVGHGVSDFFNWLIHGK